MALLKDRLLKKISQIETDKWGDRHAPVVRLSSDAVEDLLLGFTSGAIEVWTPRRSGELVFFLSISLVGVADINALDACLAEAISKALSKHTIWVRQ